MQEYCSVNLGAILQSVGDNTFEEEKLISVSQFAQQDCSDAGLGWGAVGSSQGPEPTPTEEVRQGTCLEVGRGGAVTEQWASTVTTEHNL